MGGRLVPSLCSSKVIPSLNKSPVLFLMIIQVCIHVGDNVHCPEVANSVKEVALCPKSKAEWDIAASNKKCNKIVLGKTCKNTESLSYHCVINEYRNKILEVCTPRRLISGGFCAEFNKLGGLINPHRQPKCNNEFPRCDSVYNSTDAFKYPDCYELVYNNSNFSKPITTPPQPRKLVSGNWKTIIMVVTSFFSVAVLAGAILCLLRQKSYEISKKYMPEIRIVLLGKARTGKSATGNTILGKQCFKSSISWLPITTECSLESSSRFNYSIIVLDTPGFDSQAICENFQEEIVNYKGITPPGPDVFVLVLSPTRYKKEEQQSMELFFQNFGEDVYNYIIVLFTGKDELDREKKDLSDYLKSAPPELQMFINKCGERVIAFNNRSKGQAQDAQVQELISIIREKVTFKMDKCYKK